MRQTNKTTKPQAYINPDLLQVLGHFRWGTEGQIVPRVLPSSLDGFRSRL